MGEPRHRAISTDRANPPVGPYSQGVRWDRLIFTASVAGRHPGSDDPGDDVAAHARNALENLKSIVEAGGSSLAHVLKVTLYLRDPADATTVNAVYERYFAAEPRPARAMVTVSGARFPVTFDAIAYVAD